MNISNVKKAQKRYTTRYDSTLNIQSYGGDNLYPQRMRDLILNSPTGGTCLERFQTFIEGNGFNNTQFSEYVCNRSGEMIDDIFQLVAEDIANYHGFALHVNYNMACEIVELNHVPFQDCRLEEEALDGSVPFIHVHPDWSGHKTRKGKQIKVSKEEVVCYHVFNPIKEVVLAQIVDAGGIQNFRGQILWVSMDGKWTYPKPRYDKVVTCLSVDEGLDNVKYRNVRNNFLTAGMIIHKKGQTVQVDESGNAFNVGETEDKDFSANLDVFQGDMNSCSLLDVTINQDEDKPEFVGFEGTNYDSKFTVTESSVTERIYSAFGQEPWYCIRIGKLGFSGEVLREAYEYYNSYVSKERRMVSRAFKRIFEHWHEVANASGDYNIQPLVYINSELNGASNNG